MAAITYLEDVQVAFCSMPIRLDDGAVGIVTAVFLAGWPDEVRVYWPLDAQGTNTVIQQKVRVYPAPNYTTLFGFIKECSPDCAMAIQQTNNAGNIICIYDNRQMADLPVPDEEEDEGWTIGGNFGISINLDFADMTEWAFHPQFPMFGETIDDMHKRHADFWNHIQEDFGIDFVIDGSPEGLRATT